ncbi:hypothetical protein ABH935_000668 [Catenulispora sp. GAS73]|uniref:DUF7003 family protein n=1 Tax=Catenulispora sp. GAS73 TaxID=3156269 RepID=UPI0035153B9C
MMSVLAIRSQFTQAADNAEFPDFNNGYYYPVDARLRLMRDPERWAMVVELLGYNPRGGNLFDVVHTFGSCLTSGEPGFRGDGSFLERVENMDEAEGDEETYTGAGLVVRGRRIFVEAPTGTRRSRPYACSSPRTVICSWPTPPSYTGGYPEICR